MAFVKIRIPRTSQPQDGCGIDWGNPITRGLVLASNHAQDLSNLAGDTGEPSLINAPTKTKFSKGTALSFSKAANQGINYGNSASLNPAEFTLFSLFQIHEALSAVDEYMLMSRDDATLGRAYVLSINGSQNWGVRAYINGGGGGAGLLQEGVQPSVGIPQSAAYSLSSDGFVALYRNGTQVANGSGAPSVNTTTGPTQVGIRSYAGYPGAFDGYIALSLMFNRPLTAKENKSLHDNPWQLWEPEELTIWVPDAVGAGGAATVIPIGVQANSAIGTPAAIGAAIAALTGVSATGSVGSPTATGSASIPATASPSGVSASSAVGTPAAKGAAKALPAGVQATSAVGTPLVIGGSSIPATVLPAGVAGLAYVGSPVATGQARAYPLGVQATGAVGSPVVTAGGSAVAQPQGVAASSSVGAPVARGAAVAYPLGMAGYWSVGQPVAIGQSAMPATAYPAGVSATGYVGTPVAFEASDATPSIHRAISPAQSYTATSPAQSYMAVVPAQIYST